jgi:hypothetical protein
MFLAPLHLGARQFDHDQPNLASATQAIEFL